MPHAPMTKIMKTTNRDFIPVVSNLLLKNSWRLTLPTLASHLCCGGSFRIGMPLVPRGPFYLPMKAIVAALPRTSDEAHHIRKNSKPV